MDGSGMELSPIFSMLPRCQDTTRLQAGTTLMTEAAGGILSLTNGSICRSDTEANMIGKDPLHISLAPFFAGQILITQNLGSKLRKEWHFEKLIELDPTS